MKYEAFAIYDVKCEVFQRPFFCVAEGEALRVFIDICGDAEHPLGKHPEDYSLFAIGQYSDASGEMMPCVVRKIITGLEAFQQGRQTNLKFRSDNDEEI